MELYRRDWTRVTQRRGQRSPGSAFKHPRGDVKASNDDLLSTGAEGGQGDDFFMVAKLNLRCSRLCVPDFRGAALSSCRKPPSVGAKGGMCQASRFAQDRGEGRARLRVPNARAATRVDRYNATAIKIKSGGA